MKILDFGSLNLDYVYSVQHFVRPGETISSTRRQLFCGGKGLNQSVALAKAGADVYHAGKIGSGGEKLLDCLQEAGVDTRYVLKEENAETGHTVIQVDESGQNCIILFGGTNHQITPEEADSILRNFEAGDILLLQNEISSMAEIMKAAGKIGMRIALNPSPISKELFSYPLELVTWFLLNEIEGGELTGKEQPEEITEELLRRYPQSRVVLTLGRDGVVYRDAARSAHHGIYRVKRVDTTAAGDTFTGYFLAGEAADLPVEESLRRASVASSLAVSRAGAAPSIPCIEEVLSANLEPMVPSEL